MDTLKGDLSRSEMDAEMLVLTAEDDQENLETIDEVEDLRKSLREVVCDDNVQPKMQCLMMDPSFSMVTMQGEDSGIAWETSPSRCATPWSTEATTDPSPVVHHATAGPHPAGKIIFVMDEELMMRRKRDKENAQKNKVHKQRQLLMDSSDNIPGRPELVEVSQPNVKQDLEGDEEEPAVQLVDKDQMLFSLVSEGSEILNIIVPPKIATVDEEESRELADNLSYLEETPKTRGNSIDLSSDLVTDVLGESGAVAGGHVSQLVIPNIMDPPGAPVARPLGSARNEDYFEAFALVDAQAPGGPAVSSHGEGDPEDERNVDNQERPVQLPPTVVDHDQSDTVSLEGIHTEHLDEGFYGGTEDFTCQTPQDKEDTAKLVRLPLKPSGSTLFGSQEDILTPIFLPGGPPKIIDPILLEEPKAMAFLYTDLYEEALGNRIQEEDTKSISSDKSFHSRHSDREARGYLEKYALIDETPVVEIESSSKEQCPGEDPRVLTQDLFEFGSFLSKPDKDEILNSEEEITDFFRSSGNSSPCDIDPFPQTLEEETTKPKVTKRKASSSKKVSIQPEVQTPVEPIAISDLEMFSDDWDSDDYLMDSEEQHVGRTDQGMKTEMAETFTPVAPPRKKTPSAPKACLDLTPLTPVDMLENQEAGLKEQKEEEKEKASPAETADEGEEDETVQGPSNISNLTESLHMETVENGQEREAESQHPDHEVKEERTHQEEPKEALTASPTAQVKDKGNCIIL